MKSHLQETVMKEDDKVTLLERALLEYVKRYGFLNAAREYFIHFAEAAFVEDRKGH